MNNVARLAMPDAPWGPRPRMGWERGPSGDHSFLRPRSCTFSWAINPNMGDTEAEPLARKDTQDLNLNPDALPLQIQG